ncbi:DUF4913 domain-containing protein [Streptomyces sp. ECR3]|uniref:DUF4913 domain-containing protein n=1 Tax=Streptomyces sp. ECR3 TaxID=3400630 RepID=UPI003F1B2EDB
MPSPAEGSTESNHNVFRLPAGDLDDLAASLRRTIAEVREHGTLLDRLASEPTDGSSAAVRANHQYEQAARSFFILALGGAAYRDELEALTTWVDHLLLPVYGREISSARPWCARWQEHPEAVARLHGLWLAWQQYTDTEAGLAGPATWHRDHLDHVMAQLRSPEGPFAACTTSMARPSHRLLPSPADLEEETA